MRQKETPGGRPGESETSIAWADTRSLSALEQVELTALCVAFLAAVLASPPVDVARVLGILTPARVTFLDPPTGHVLAVAEQLATAGIAPTPVTVQQRCLSDGVYAGHRGDLARTRILDATTDQHTEPTMLVFLAATVAEHVIRAHALAGYAAAAERVSVATVDDIMSGFVADGRTLRADYNALTALRGAIGVEATA